MKTVRVMHLLDNLNFAGLEQVVMRLSNHMHTDQKFEIQICAIEDIVEESKHFLNDDIQIFSLKKQKNDFTKILKLMTILFSQRINILHSHNWSSFFIARIASMFLSIRHIHCEHGFESTNPYFSWKRNFITKILYPTVFTIVGVSNDIKNFFQANFKNQNIIVIKNGINTSVFYPKIDTNNDIRKSLKISENTVVIIAVAFPRLVKNLQLLINVIHKLKQMEKDIHLIYVGGDEITTAKLRQQAHDLNLQKTISFLGSRIDIPNLLSASDIYINCSLFEGLSCSILEAMGCGLPIVASDVGGNSEIVIHNHNGYLFNVKSEDDCANKLVELIDSFEIRKKFGNKSLKKIIKEFDIKKQIELYKELYLK